MPLYSWGGIYNEGVLRGTCEYSKQDWRKEVIIPILEGLNINYFNPVVDDWTEESKEVEEEQKIECDVHLYIITPDILGVINY